MFIISCMMYTRIAVPQRCCTQGCASRSRLLAPVWRLQARCFNQMQSASEHHVYSLIAIIAIIAAIAIIAIIAIIYIYNSYYSHNSYTLRLHRSAASELSPFIHDYMYIYIYIYIYTHMYIYIYM